MSNAIVGIPVQQAGEHTTLLACPVCGGSNIHPVRLDCISPGQRNGCVTIDSNGVAIDPRYPPAGRGVRIELAFSCEDGHEFVYALQFHKGSTEVVSHTRDIHSSHETIWRD
ncbi:MAG TPA: hypothetical protein ENH78_11790 [Phycisphaerae bacterium]|nr:hypothetical protein [Phycisphaerae bacterium]